MQHEVIGPVAAGSCRRSPRRAPRSPAARSCSSRHVGEIDQRRGAAEQRRHADLLGPCGDRAACRPGLIQRMVHVHVRVDAARHDDLACRVDHALRASLSASVPGAATRGDGLARRWPHRSATTPCGVTTSPPRMIRSSIARPVARRFDPAPDFAPRAPRRKELFRAHACCGAPPARLPGGLRSCHDRDDRRHSPTKTAAKPRA